MLLAPLLAALSLAGCGGSSAPKVKLPAGDSNLQSIIEAEGFLHSQTVQALQFFHNMGVNLVRVYVWWAGDQGIAPDPRSRHAPTHFDATNPAAYPARNWVTYDAIVRDAAQIGVGVDMTIGPPPPLWAATPGAPTHVLARAADWKPSPAAYTQFVEALGKRYSGHYKPHGSRTPLPRVKFWAIWNEPNYGQYLAPQAIDHSTVEISPSLYRRLVDAAWKGLAATGHTTRTDTIVIGETAPRGLSGPNLPGNFSGMVPLRFIRALYCIGSNYQKLSGAAAVQRGCPATAAGSASFAAHNPGLFQATGWADHPYPDLLPPTERTTGQPLDADYADFAALPSLGYTLDRAFAAYGQHRKLPIYSTEFGYRTNPPKTPYGGLPPETAAAYLNQAEYLSWRNPRIRTYDQYLVTDPPAGSGSFFVSGIEFYTGVPKPYVYDAFRMPLWLPATGGRPGGPRVVWGCVRPAPEIERSTRKTQIVMIQFARAGGAYKTVSKVTLSKSSCYFETAVQFAGKGAVRLAWSGSGQLLYSRSQTISG